jgi:hypothetical protein
MALGSTQPLVKMSTRNILGGKCGRCVRLTTSPPSRAECHENWEPKPPGTLRATRSLLRYCFTLHFDGPFTQVLSFPSKTLGKLYCRKLYSAGQEMQDFTAKPQIYYLINQLHISATVGSHHQTDQSNAKERRKVSTFAILIGDFEQKKCVI